MIAYDAIIIGFGKAGKTLAGELANREWKVALVEKNPKMYGGTCINVACIPTKLLAYDSQRGIPYHDAIERKNKVVEELRKNNYENLAERKQITIYDAEATFRSNKEVELHAAGKKEVLTAEYIFINTGAESNLPPLKGDMDSDKLYTSTTLINEEKLPERLAIVGGGYIGLEYASMYQNFGADVTVIHSDDELMPNEDREIADEVQSVLEEKGVRFLYGVKAEEVRENEDITLTLSNGEQITADAVLLATGRKPNTNNLGLDQTSIELTKDGEIKVNDHLETTVEHVYALGDVKGGMQFTYVSLDDARIVMDSLFGDQDYSLQKRQNIPYSLFIDPPLSRVGLTAEEAKKKGYRVKEGALQVASHPRAKVIDDQRGLFKAVVDEETESILGVSLFGPQSEELINFVKLAMDKNIPYTYLRDQVYNHPVMMESFNQLFSSLK